MAFSGRFPVVSGATAPAFGPFGTGGPPMTGLPAGYSLGPKASPAAVYTTGGLQASTAATHWNAPVSWNSPASVYAWPSHQ
jgi:hypothetical protein